MPPFHARVRSASDFGLILQTARDGQGWSQRELAAQLGMSQRAISEMESGRPTLWARRLFELLRANGIELTATWKDPDDESDQ